MKRFLLAFFLLLFCLNSFAVLDAWNNSASITVVTPAFDVNIGTMFKAENLDVSGLGLSSLDEIRIANMDTGTDLDRNVMGTTGSKDLNVYFLNNEPLTASTTYAEKFRIFWGNASPTRPSDFNELGTFKTYEDGDNNQFSPLNNVGVCDCNGSSGGDGGIKIDGPIKFGCAALRANNAGAIIKPTITTYGIPKYFSNWIQGNNGTIDAAGFYLEDIATATLAGLLMYSGGIFYDTMDVAQTSFATVPSDLNLWYKFEIILYATSADFRIHSTTDGNVIAAAIDIPYTDSDFDTDFYAISLRGGATSSGYHDNTVWGGFIKTNQILFNSKTDVNLLGDLNNYGFLNGGRDINAVFSVSDIDSNASDFLVDLNLSIDPSVGQSDYVVFADFNLAIDFNAFGGHDTNDLGLGFDVNFTFPFTLPSWDRNVFACINFKNRRYDLNYSRCTPVSIMIDSTNPQTIGDANLVNNSWQAKDANILFSCTDNNSGCFRTAWRLDTDPTAGVSYGDWNFSFDVNVPLVSYGRFDGNFALDFNSTDNAGHIEDVNTFYVLVDLNAPVPSVWNSYPIVNETSTSVAQTTFKIRIVDSESGNLGKCWFGVFKAGLLDFNGVVDANADGWCSRASSILADGQSTYIIWNQFSDTLGNDENIVAVSAVYTYDTGGGAPPVPPSGGSGGGSALNYSFEVREPEKKSFAFIATVGSSQSFEIVLQNTSTLTITVFSEVDANLAGLISCAKSLALEKGKSGRLVCSLLVSDLNAFGEGFTPFIDGSIRVFTASKSESLPVRIQVYSFGGLGMLSSWVKSSFASFVLALMCLAISVTVVYLGVRGFFKKGFKQFVSIFGGGGLALLILLALVL